MAKGKSEILYAVPVEPCRRNGWHVRRDGIKKELEKYAILTVNGIVCAALSLSLVVLLNKQDRMLFRLSPVFLMVVAVSFSMLIRVLWEFFEFGVDRIWKKDMQKDTWVSEISTVSPDAVSDSRVTTISPIEKVAINDGEVVLNGYLDIGLYDTMEDLEETVAGSNGQSAGNG